MCLMQRIWKTEMMENKYKFPFFGWEEKLEDEQDGLFEFTITSLLHKK